MNSGGLSEEKCGSSIVTLMFTRETGKVESPSPSESNSNGVLSLSAETPGSKNEK